MTAWNTNRSATRNAASRPRKKKARSNRDSALAARRLRRRRAMAAVVIPADWDRPAWASAVGWGHENTTGFVDRAGAELSAGGRGGGEPQVRPVVNREYRLRCQADQRGERIHRVYPARANDDRTMAVVEKALAAAVQRGVRVRGLLDDGCGSMRRSWSAAGDGGGGQTDTPEKMTHCKVIVTGGWCCWGPPTDRQLDV